MNDTVNGPEYVARAAEEVWDGPSECRHVKIHGFVVKGDGRLLDEALDRYIERPSLELGLPVTVDAMSDRVLFVFVESERVQTPTVTAGGQPKQQAAHSECLFAIVVFGAQTSPAPGPFAFAPYVYATPMPGWRAEREIFGYPQQLADISITDDLMEVETAAIEKFGPDALATRMSILKITRTGTAKPDLCSEVELAEKISQAMRPSWIEGADRPSASSAREASQKLGGWRQRRSAAAMRGRFGVTAADEQFLNQQDRETPDLDPPEDTHDSAASNASPSVWPGANPDGTPRFGFCMLFLKQFRDIVFADRACYQAIVQASVETTGYISGSAWTSQGYDLTLKKLDSAPIVRELGVEPGQILLAFGVQFDRMTISDRDRPATVVSNPSWNPATQTATADEHPRLPRYVERGGEAVWRQPSMLYGARVYGFGVKVAPEHQRKMLKKYVNDVVERCDVTYGPFKFRLAPCQGVDTVMLMFVEYTRVASGTDDDSRLGGVSYREFLVTQLAFYDDLEFPELNWLIPFIYLDKDAPRLSGREIYGYPKQLGTIPPFEPFTVDGREIEVRRALELHATVLPNPHALKAIPEYIVRVSSEEPPVTLKQYTQASDMIEGLLKVSTPLFQRGQKLFSDGGFGLGVDVVNALVSGGVGHVFLKQFRDSAYPKTACYQAVCKTDTVPGKFRGGACVSHEPYRIKIAESASEQLLNYLGKSAEEGRNGIKPDFAYWMDLDVELTTGRVIANAFERGFTPDRTNPDKRDRGPGRRIPRTGELAL